MTTPGQPTELLNARARRRGDAALAGLHGDEQAARALVLDPDPEVRGAALAALVRTGAATRHDAARALVDPDPIVRRRACELAPRLPGACYQDLLEDPDVSVVEAACFALGEVGETSSARRLAVIVRAHHDPLCRESAVAALGALGALGVLDGLDAVLEALADVATVRRRAAVALAAFDPAKTQAALFSCLEDRDWQVRQIAEDLLGR